MTTATSKFDVGKYLVDDEAIANYLDASLEEGGASLFLKAVGEVARARGMTEVAEGAGLTRASLYKSLGEGGNPGMSTMEKVIDSLGFRLAVVRKDDTSRRASRAKVQVMVIEDKPAAKAAARSSREITNTPAYTHVHVARKTGTGEARMTGDTGHFVRRAAADRATSAKDKSPASAEKRRK